MAVKLLYVHQDGTLHPTRQGGMPVVDAGAGLVVCERIACRYSPGDPEETDDGLPFEVTIVAAYSELSRTYEIESTEVRRVADGPPLTSHSIRSLPLAGWLRGLSYRAIVGVIDWTVEGRTVIAIPREIRPNNELPRQLDDPAYRKIAIVHRIAELVGNRATTEVAEHFQVGRTTAYNWVKEIEARDLWRPIWRQGDEPPEERNDDGRSLVDIMIYLESRGSPAARG